MNKYSKGTSMKDTVYTYTGLAVLALSLTSLTGCNGGIDMYAPDSVTHNRVQVSEDLFTQDVALSDADDAYLMWLAQHYMKHGGDTSLDMVVTYDPRSYRSTAMKAGNKASDIVSILRGRGVSNVKASVLPVKDQGDVSRLLVSYNSYTASAPKDCPEVMPGMDGGGLEHNADYKIGCTIETVLARQIAKPSHLLGRGAKGGYKDGRASANVVEGYRTGAPNESLDGESASAE